MSRLVKWKGKNYKLEGGYLFSSKELESAKARYWRWRKK